MTGRPGGARGSGGTGRWDDSQAATYVTSRVAPAPLGQSSQRDRQAGLQQQRSQQRQRQQPQTGEDEVTGKRRSQGEQGQQNGGNGGNSRNGRLLHESRRLLARWLATGCWWSQVAISAPHQQKLKGPARCEECRRHVERPPLLLFPPFPPFC